MREVEKIEEVNKFKEIFKLREMLTKANIPFTWLDWRKDFDFPFGEKYQIVYPNTGPSESICSCIEGIGSIGENLDLLEIMGLLTPEEEERDSVAGNLTAEEVFQRIKKDYEGRKNNGR